MPAFKTDPYTAATPGRKTHVRLDVPTNVTIEKEFAMGRRFSEIGRVGAGAVRDNVELRKGVGWLLHSYHSELNAVHETASADARILTASSGRAQVASGMLEAPYYRANTDLTGVTGQGQRSPGDMFITKAVTAGASWNSALSADQIAYPPPSPGDDRVPLDRVLVGTVGQQPDEAISLRLIVPAQNFTAFQRLATIYFVGPAGVRGTSVGNGNYALTLWGDGRSDLHEQAKEGAGAPQWRLRYQARWAREQLVGVSAHMITIKSNARQTTHGWVGDLIAFSFTQMAEQGGIGSALITSLSMLGMEAIDPLSHVYRVPMDGKTQPAPSVVPIRFDVRRDIRATFQIGLHTYVPSGSLEDAPFRLDSRIGQLTVPFRVWLAGYIPSGCTLEMQMYDKDTGATLTRSNVVGGVFGISATFTPTAPGQNYYVKFLWTGNGTGSAILSSYSVARDASTSTLVPLQETEPEIVRSVSIMGSGRNPTTERAEIGIEDPTGALALLNTRARIPIIVETEHDPTDPTARSTLFQGFVMRAGAGRKGTHRSDNRAYPTVNWRRFSAQCIGEWERLSRRLSPVNFNYATQPQLTSGGEAAPYKVTDVIRSLLQLAGYKAWQIDVPDIATRLYAVDDQPLFLEAYSPIGDVVLRLCQDYLGGYLLWDPNAADTSVAKERDSSGRWIDQDGVLVPMGMWRLKIAAKAPYVNLAEFLTDPGLPAGTLAHSILAYPDGGNQAQPIKRTYVRKRTLQTYVEPPEANMIIVSGVTLGGSSLTNAPVESKLTQTAYNWVSASFFDGQPIPPDPRHPDYLGDVLPLVHLDPGLTSENAVNWVTRRLFDIATHAVKVVTFEAPLLLVQESADPKQRNLRPLRYYDPVLVDGQQFLVYSVTPSYGKDGAGIMGDRAQMAVYELHAPSFIQT